MTTKTISGTYASGYTLHATYSGLSIANSGSIAGSYGSVGGGGTFAGYAGGAGYAALTISRPVTVLSRGTIIGGAGGAGGAGSPGSGGPYPYGPYYGGPGGNGGNGGAGVDMQGGGRLVNYGFIAGGSGGDGGPGTAPYPGVNGIGGTDGAGVRLEQYGSVANLGTILGDPGVELLAGGSLINGSSSDRTAFINAVQASGAVTVTNFGTILDGGVSLSGLSSVVNYGSIGWVDGGVNLSGGGSLQNGSPSDDTAVIYGYVSVKVSGAATVTNFATIGGPEPGYRSVSVDLTAANERVVAEAGADFIGGVIGGGGVLELVGGGSLAGLGGVGTRNTGTLSGASRATFSGFGAYLLDQGAVWTLSGANELAAAHNLIVDGELKLPGTGGGRLTVTGSVGGAGILDVAGGTLALGAGAGFGIAQLEASSGAIDVAASLAFSGEWTQRGGTLSVGRGATLTLANTSDLIAGTLQGAGVLAAPAGRLVVGKAGLTIGKDAFLGMEAMSRVVGSNVTTLANAGRIVGAGDLGGGALALVNQVGGSLVGNAKTAFVIDVGTGTIANAGHIDCMNVGGVMIESAVANTGLLYVSAGTLQALGLVTGAGSVRIAGGTADFARAFGENVAFTGPSGVLELADSEGYAGTVSGFATGG